MLISYNQSTSYLAIYLFVVQCITLKLLVIYLVKKCSELWNLKIHHHVYKRVPLDPLSSLLNPINNFTFNTIHIKKLYVLDTVYLIFSLHRSSYRRLNICIDCYTIEKIIYILCAYRTVITAFITFVTVQ
jgi:hypothetical protein